MLQVNPVPFLFLFWASKKVKEVPTPGAQGGHPVYDSISSLYIATSDLRIEPYDPVVVPDNDYNPAELIRLVNQRFHMDRAVWVCVWMGNGITCY